MWRQTIPAAPALMPPHARPTPAAPPTPASCHHPRHHPAPGCVLHQLRLLHLPAPWPLQLPPVLAAWPLLVALLPLRCQPAVLSSHSCGVHVPLQLLADPRLVPAAEAPPPAPDAQAGDAVAVLRWVSARGCGLLARLRAPWHVPALRPLPPHQAGPGPSQAGGGPSRSCDLL